MRTPIVVLVFTFCFSVLSLAGESRLSQEIDDFFHDPEIVDFRISPGGENLTYGEYLERSRRSLMSVDFSKGESQGLAAGPGQDIYSQGWVGPDTFIGVKAGLEGNRALGIFSAKVLFHDIENLDGGFEIFPRVIHTMPQDPKVCAVINRKVKTRYPDIHIMNVRSGELISRYKNPGKAVRFFLDTHGTPRVAKCIGNEEGSVVWMYRGSERDSEWEVLELDREIEDWRFFDTGSIAYAEVHDEVRVFVQPFDLEKRALVGKAIRSDQCDVTVDGFRHDPTTLGLFGIRIDEDKPRNIWFEPALTDLESKLSAVFGDALVTFLGVNSITNAIYIHTQSDIDPGSYFALRPDGSLVLIARSNTALGAYKLARTRPIEFENRDGQQISGYLTMPAGLEENAPLLVVPHGGPHSQDRWGFDAKTQFFAHKGIAVLKVNYRGSSGYGRAFWEQDGFESILVRSVDDVIDATKWAVSEGFADAKRIGIVGGSFGGYISLEAVSREPEMYQCASGFAGVYDWPRQLAASRRNDSFEWDWFVGEKFGDLRENEARYRELSPMSHLNRVQVPILLFHGKNDSVVEAAQSKSLHKELLKLGKQSKLELDTWGRHGFIDEKRRSSFFTRQFEFIEKHLLY